MLKRIISIIVAFTLAVGMCSCSEQESRKDEPVSPSSPVVTNNQQMLEAVPTSNYTFQKASGDQKNDEAALAALGGFSVELFKNSVKEDLANGKNTLVSPESVAFALGMTANGAQGRTLEQFRQTLFKDVNIDTFNRNMNLLVSNANSNNMKESKLKIANSVWVRDAQDMTLNDKFAKCCKELYNAELIRATFDQGTVDRINNWVNDKTDKMIPRVISQLDEQTQAVLINCIAFDSQWQSPYEQAQIKKDQEFTNAGGEVKNCTMLCSGENQYVSDGKAQGFIKDYFGGKYAFMAVLPNEDISISDYVSSMDADGFAKLYAGRSMDYMVYTRMPEFTYDYDIVLNGTLKSMGITDAFSDAADFSGMTDDDSLKIGLVLHKTHIDLNAKGTKAAAATVITMDKSEEFVAEQPIKEVYLDRPFVYAIMDVQTGLPVFMGTVCDPSV